MGFKKKIGHIEGSQLLLKLCGWDYIEGKIKNDGIYVFNSSLTRKWIKMVSELFQFYIEQKIKQNVNKNKNDNKMKIDDDIPIITDFPRKKLKPKNEKMGKQKRRFPKIHKLSKQELREKRLRNLGNIHDENYGIVPNDANNENMVGP